MTARSQNYVVALLSLQLLFPNVLLCESTVITGSSVRFNEFSKFILESQQKIIKQLEDEDGKASFCQDEWQKGESVSKECSYSGFIEYLFLTSIQYLIHLFLYLYDSLLIYSSFYFFIYSLF